MTGRGLIVVYRWSVEPHAVGSFEAQWRALTDRLRPLGGLGSCLTRTAAGEFVALAAWPDRETRIAAFAALEAQPAIPGVERRSAEELEVAADLWCSSPFGQTRAPGLPDGQAAGDTA